MACRVLDLMGRVEDAKIELDEWYEKMAKEYESLQRNKDYNKDDFDILM